MSATISLRDYLDKKKQFVIPNYQRGYVWGKNNKNGGKDAVTFMMDSLISGFINNTEVFIQGVTVSETESVNGTDQKIILVDGQQRTTFFYLLLRSLHYDGEFNIHYDIRTQSNDFLNSDTLLDNIEEKRDEEYQDIYFFKKSLRIIKQKLEELEKKEDFLTYVLNSVKFLYIDIPIDKATTVFSMMNGNKAEMKPEELIKAELLRLASLNETATSDMSEKDLYAIEWDNNMLRSRYAREWDKWLQWWKRDDVKTFYKVDRVMGLLVETYLKKETDKISFESFRTVFLSDQKSIDAKHTFDGLRRLQKRFEDAFNDAQTYNRIGAIIRIKSNNDSDIDKFIQWYFVSDSVPSPEELDRYYRWKFIDVTHNEIIGNNTEVFTSKYEEYYNIISSNDLYNENKEKAFQLLLRLNIDEDNLQEDGRGRKFDFSIWDNYYRGRSLEHIYPKSKVYHKEMNEDMIVYKDGTKEANILSESEIKKEESGYISRESCKYGAETASEHSIGNLVLLYKDENSSFNNSSFEDKKAMFFKKPSGNKEIKAIFKSRHLLHTIYKFANSKWDGPEIAKNKTQTLKDFREYYGKE